jgi:hypothetical protein
MAEKFVSIRLFMDSTDEKLFSEAILKTHPDVIFILGSRWKSPNPPVQRVSLKVMAVLLLKIITLITCYEI